MSNADSAAECFYRGIAPLGDSAARNKIVRLWLLTAPAADAAEWRRLIQREKKAAQRSAGNPVGPANVPPAASITGGQTANVPLVPSIPRGQDDDVPSVQRESGGQNGISTLPPSPAPSPGPPSPPAPTHVLPPVVPQVPQVSPLPAADGAGKRAKEPKAEKPESPPDPRFTPVTDGYCAAYLETFGSPYVHNGGRDGKKLKLFLRTANPEEFTTARILKIAKAAMRRSGEPFAKATKFASSLHGFCDQFNAIRAELIATNSNGNTGGFSLSAAAPSKARDPTPEQIAAWLDTVPAYAAKRNEWTTWDRLPPFAREQFWQAQKHRRQPQPTEAAP